MSRKQNKQIAQENLEFETDHAPAYVYKMPSGLSKYASDPEVEIHTATTQASVIDLWERGYDSIAVLNFASAKNPGGGYVNGAHSQEESLCRSIPNLHPSLEKSNAYPLKSPYVLVSEHMKLVRNPKHEIINNPIDLTVVSAAAPNMRHPHTNKEQTKCDLERRIRTTCETIVSAASDCDTLVLGAWGCGVFKNDPFMIANELQMAVEKYGKQLLVVYAVPDLELQKAFNWAVYRR
jgi:uncharacterized protein (TIGR02452 family)